VLRTDGASGVQEILGPFAHQAGSRAPSPLRTLGRYTLAVRVDQVEWERRWRQALRGIEPPARLAAGGIAECRPVCERLPYQEHGVARCFAGACSIKGISVNALASSHFTLSHSAKTRHAAKALENICPTSCERMNV